MPKKEKGIPPAMATRVGKAAIPCPECQSVNSIVIDSRVADGTINRRRACPAGHRYSTVERVVVESRSTEPTPPKATWKQVYERTR